MGKHLVLAGAGHAHMVTIHNLAELRRRDHQVTVIGPSPIHYYSGMGPGMLGGTYTPEDISFTSREHVEGRGGIFIEDRVIRIDPVKRLVVLQSGANIGYDVLSCNLGSSVRQVFETDIKTNVYSVKPIQNLVDARKSLSRFNAKIPLEIAIIGGGPSSVELAGNVVQLLAEKKHETHNIQICCRTVLMKGFSLKVQAACRKFLLKQGVDIIENDPVVSLKRCSVILQSGRSVDAEVIFTASGIQPSTVFRESGMECGPDGGLLVNRYLQCPDYPEVFGGGDCIYYHPQPLDKVGVYAVRQNPVLYHNLLASLEGLPLKEFSPGGDYLLIFNLGNSYGVLQKGRFFLKGRLAFIIKDYIDRKFMAKFQ